MDTVSSAIVQYAQHSGRQHITIACLQAQANDQPNTNVQELLFHNRRPIANLIWHASADTPTSLMRNFACTIAAFQDVGVYLGDSLS